LEALRDWGRSDSRRCLLTIFLSFGRAPLFQRTRSRRGSVSRIVAHIIVGASLQIVVSLSRVSGDPATSQPWRLHIAGRRLQRATPSNHSYGIRVSSSTTGWVVTSIVESAYNAGAHGLRCPCRVPSRGRPGVSLPSSFCHLVQRIPGCVALPLFERVSMGRRRRFCLGSPNRWNTPGRAVVTSPARPLTGTELLGRSMGVQRRGQMTSGSWRVCRTSVSACASATCVKYVIGAHPRVLSEQVLGTRLGHTSGPSSVSATPNSMHHTHLGLLLGCLSSTLIAAYHS